MHKLLFWIIIPFISNVQLAAVWFIHSFCKFQPIRLSREEIHDIIFPLFSCINDLEKLNNWKLFRSSKLWWSFLFCCDLSDRGAQIPARLFDRCYSMMRHMLLILTILIRPKWYTLKKKLIGTRNGVLKSGAHRISVSRISEYVLVKFFCYKCGMKRMQDSKINAQLKYCI